MEQECSEMQERQRVMCDMNVESSLLGVGRHKEERRVGRCAVETSKKDTFWRMP